MAPYNPPNAHYSQVDVSAYDEKMILSMIGKGGQGFYNLTDYLRMEYVWYDQERKVIELWGSFNSFKRGAADKLRRALTRFNQRYV